MYAPPLAHRLFNGLLCRAVTRFWPKVLPEVVNRGGITQHLIDRHCTGAGIEIGAGARPYAPRDPTIFVDRLSRFFQHDDMNLDVLADAASLPFANGSLDYLVSAHTLEHVQDALGTLHEWGRVLRPGGTLLLILPHAERTMDEGRPLDTLPHHQAELGKTPSMNDPPHFDEVMEHWTREPAHPDSWMHDPDATQPDGSWNRRWIAEHALLHYHCWTQHEMVPIVVASGLRILSVLDQTPERPDSFMVVAQR